MFLTFVKTVIEFVYSFCTSDYGKLKQHGDDSADEEKTAMLSDSFYIHIQESCEKAFCDD